MRAKVWWAAAAMAGAAMCRAQGPAIQSLDATGRLTFAETPGAIGYQVESTLSLGSAWSDSGLSADPTGSGTVSVVVTPPAAGAAFYRVVGVVITNPPDMVYIPAGSFSMGDAFNEGYNSERPVHIVYVNAFFMDQCEVTKARWDEVYAWATDNDYAFESVGSGKAVDHPVHTVNWFDCVKWCNARSEKEGLTPCYTVEGRVYKTGRSAPDCDWSAGGYRLPTEAEWEKAARGAADSRRFPWSDDSTIQHARANYHSRTQYAYDTSPTRGYHPAYTNEPTPYTSPVGSFAANGYGVHDVAGNLWEWCWDWFASDYYASSPVTDPRGPTDGSFRMQRGGAWDVSAFDARCAIRVSSSPADKQYHNGFRCAKGL